MYEDPLGLGIKPCAEFENAKPEANLGWWALYEAVYECIFFLWFRYVAIVFLE